MNQILRKLSTQLVRPLVYLNTPVLLMAVTFSIALAYTSGTASPMTTHGKPSTSMQQMVLEQVQSASSDVASPTSADTAQDDSPSAPAIPHGSDASSDVSTSSGESDSTAASGQASGTTAACGSDACNGSVVDRPWVSHKKCAECRAMDSTSDDPAITCPSYCKPAPNQPVYN